MRMNIPPAPPPPPLPDPMIKLRDEFAMEIMKLMISSLAAQGAGLDVIKRSLRTVYVMADDVLSEVRGAR